MFIHRYGTRSEEEGPRFSEGPFFGGAFTPKYAYPPPPPQKKKKVHTFHCPQSFVSPNFKKSSSNLLSLQETLKTIHLTCRERLRLISEMRVSLNMLKTPLC